MIKCNKCIPNALQSNSNYNKKNKKLIFLYPGAQLSGGSRISQSEGGAPSLELGQKPERKVGSRGRTLCGWREHGRSDISLPTHIISNWSISPVMPLRSYLQNEWEIRIWGNNFQMLLRKCKQSLDGIWKVLIFFIEPIFLQTIKSLLCLSSSNDHN